MSKKPRTFQSPEPGTPRPASDGQPAPGGSGDAAASTTPASTPSTSSGPSRADARRRSSSPKAAATPSFFERYRVFIIGGAAVVVVLLGLLFFTRSSTQAYECATFLTPPPAEAPESGGAPTTTDAPAPSSAPAATTAPAPSAAPGSPTTGAAPSPAASAAPSASPAATPRLGFQTSDLGKTHVVQGSTVRYAYCPPASGNHYNLGGGQAPLARRFFDPTDTVIPPQWIHNLEHGDVVLLYRGDPGQEILDEMRTIMDEAAVSDWSLQNCGDVNKVIALRFDDMDPGVNFAAVAWDRVLLLEQFDAEQLLAFANQWQDGAQTPERICS